MRLFNSWDYSFCNNKECIYKTRCKRYIKNYDNRPEYLSFILVENYLSCGYFIDGKEEEDE